MNKGHHRAHGCHRSRWEQCRSERLCRDIREKYCGRAHRSPLPGRVIARTPYSCKYRLPHKVNFVTDRFCVQAGGARSSNPAGKLQAGHPKRQSHYSHQEANKHNPQGANGFSGFAKFGASFIACHNEAFVDPYKPDVYQL